MKIFLTIILGFYIPLLFAGPQTITISNLPISDKEDTQVCHDAGTGKLGRCSAAATATPKRIAWVSNQGGGDYSSPIDAMDDLAAWCSSPNFQNQCLLRIAPGRYQLGSETLHMVAYVNIQGSGMFATLISSTVSSATNGTVNGARGSTLSDIWITNGASGSFGTAIAANNVAFFNIDRVYINNGGSPTFSTGLKIQSVINSSGSTIVSVSNSQFVVGTGDTNTAIRVNNEVTILQSTVQIRNSRLEALGESGVSLLVTSFDGSAEASLEHSEAGVLKRTGTGQTFLWVRWSRIKEVIDTGAVGGVWCSFVIESPTFVDTQHTSTCP